MIVAMLHNLIFYIISLLGTLFLVIPLLSLTYLPAWVPGVKPIFYGALWGINKLMLVALLVPIEYKGLEHVPAINQKAIFVANHQSTLDLFLIGDVVQHRPQTWLSWNKWWNYPVLGQVVNYSCIPVYFGDKPLGSSAVRSSVDRINAGHSIVLFPESQRFYDGAIHEFKTGFAAMAKLTNLPVVPIYIDGVSDLLPPKSRMLQWNKLALNVGKPFTMDQNETVKEFKDRVREWFLEQNRAKKKA